MSLILSANTNTSMPLIEAGPHPAVCYGLIDLGHQYNEKFEKSTHKCLVMFELMDEQFTNKQGEEVNRTMSSTYTMSLNDKAKLYKDLIAWRGKPFTDDELKKFDLKNVVGAPCLLNVVHTERNGNTFANIQSLMKLPKSMAGMIVPTIDKVIFDIDETDLSMLDTLPEWIKTRVEESDEYKDRMAGQGHGADADYTEGGLKQGVFTDMGDDEGGQLPF